MSRLTRVLPALILLALPAAAAADPQTPSAASEPARPGADPERLALARTLVEQSGGEAALRERMQALYGVMFKAIAEAMPKDQAALAAVMQTRVQDEISGLLPKIIEISQDAYAEALTTQELEDVIAFNDSPTGRSLRVKLPEVTQTAMRRTMPLIVQEMPRIMRTVVADACVQLACTPAQKAAAVASMDRALKGAGR
jgi:hypothetical protein